MTCTGRECTDPAQAFKREDGHTYTVRFLLQGRSNDVLFGDWAESTLAMEPAVYLRVCRRRSTSRRSPPAVGLSRSSQGPPKTWDNCEHPWPHSHQRQHAGSGCAGRLRCRDQWSWRATGCPEGHSSFRTATWQLRSLISFVADGPSPAGMSASSAHPCELESIEAGRGDRGAAVDFGTVLFDTSPNFRVNQTVYMPVAFDESPFNLTPEPISSSCPGLELVAGPPEMQGPAYRMPLTLRSSGPIAPQTCSGAFALRGPSEDYDVNPETPLSWRLVIPAVEWEILVSSRTERARPTQHGQPRKGRRAQDATLHVRYTGKPPFSLQLSDLNASTEHSGVTAGKDDLDLVTASPVSEGGRCRRI